MLGQDPDGQPKELQLDPDGNLKVTGISGGGGGGGGAITVANGADVNAGATTDTPLKNGWDTDPGTGTGTQTDAGSQGTMSRKLGGLHLLLSKAYNQVRDSFKVTSNDGHIVTLGANADTNVVGDTAGSVSAKLRGLNRIINSVWDSANSRLKVDGSGVTQPISASALPLPAGASTSALQTAGNTSLASINTTLNTVLDTNTGSLKVISNIIPNYQDDLRSRAVVEHRFNRYTSNATGQLIDRSGVLHTAWVVFTGTPVAGTITLYDNLSGTNSSEALVRFDILTTSTGTMAIPISLDIWCDAGVRAEYSVANTNARVEIAFK